MNYLDFVILIPVLWGAFKGFKNGFINEVGAVIALVLGIWLASMFTTDVSVWLSQYTDIAVPYREISAWALIFFVVILICFMIIKILQRFFNALNLLWLDRTLGIVFGAVKWLIITALLLLLAQMVITHTREKPVEAIEKSMFAKPLIGAVSKAWKDSGIYLPSTGIDPSVENKGPIQNRKSPK